MSTPRLPDARDRITDGFNRSRVKLEARRAAVPLLILLVGALVSLTAWLTIFKHVGRQLYAKTSEVGFVVSDASSVSGGGRQELRFKGVPAGVIQSVELRDGRPFITAKVYSEFLPIYRDARVNLRPSTALEDMYLDVVDRGSSAAGQASVQRPVPSQNVRVGVQVEDVLQALQPDVRRSLSSLLDELGQGLTDRGDELRAAFVQVVPFLQAAGRVSDQLARRQTATRQLVTNTANISDELARRDRALRALVADAGSSLRTLENGSADLEATLRHLPATLSSADASLAAVRAALPDLDHALVGLRGVADELPAGLRAVRELSGDAQPALTRLQPAVAKLESLARYLTPSAQWLEQTTSRVRPQIPAVDHATRTTAGCSAALQGFFQWTPSVMKLGDARGAVVRGQAVVGLASTAAVKDPAVVPRLSCAPGGPLGGEPGPGGTRATSGASR